VSPFPDDHADQLAHHAAAGAVEVIERAIAAGAARDGVELPAGFALERARNIAAQLMAPLLDLYAAGYERGRAT